MLNLWTMIHNFIAPVAFESRFFGGYLPGFFASRYFREIFRKLINQYAAPGDYRSRPLRLGRSLTCSLGANLDDCRQG